MRPEIEIYLAYLIVDSSRKEFVESERKIMYDINMCEKFSQKTLLYKIYLKHNIYVNILYFLYSILF